MLTSILNGSSSSIALTNILLCSLAALVLGIFIALTHKYTSKGTKNFLITLATLPLIVEAVILMVNGNLGTSIATLGVFGLIRFRSLPATSKEILTVFFAMAVGLACGMGHIAFAALITLIGCFAIFLFNNIKLFDQKETTKVLKITLPEDLDYTSVFDQEFAKYTASHKLVSVKTTNMGSLFEVKYSVDLKNNINEKEFIDELRTKNGNLKVMLSHPLEESEF